MSLILEALRKSEAERRRGEVPDLLSPSGPVARRTGSHAVRGWPWLVVGFAAVLALPVAWMMRGGPDADRTDAPQQASAGPGAEAGGPSADTSVEASAATTASAGTHPPAAPEVAASPAPGQPPEAVVASTPAPSPPAPSSVSPPPTPEPMRPEPARPEPLPGPLAGPPAVTAAEPAPLPSPEPASEPAPPSVPVAVPAPPAMARPDVEPPMSLARLPVGERGQLPPLKVSMHMWSEDVARRFAIVDGRRVGEGDRVGDAVVTAITRDGVVLDWRGRRIEVPIH